jgi:nitronate monooxygenase
LNCVICLFVLALVISSELPLIQAPMAGVQGSALAAAVARAGGIGSLPCALLSPDAIRDEIAAITAQTDRPYNLNFFCHAAPAEDAARERRWRELLAPYYRECGIDPDVVTPNPVRRPFDAEAAAVIEACRPPVVSFHFGLPTPDLVARVRATGARILSSATTVDEAVWLERHGVDAIIAQGSEAGGHRGMFLGNDVSTQVGTLALVPQIVRAVRVPVIAAGGIADARGVAAAIALGAVAVQVGTAFLLCPEATTSPVHRAALASDSARETALTNVFTGRPARAIVNRLMRELGPMTPAAPAFPLAATAVLPLRHHAEPRGSGEFSALWCGQNASGAQPVPAGDLVRTLCG